MDKIKTTLCLLKKDDMILLAMKKRGFGEGKYNGVGGKLKENETPEEAMIRETEEEILVTPTKYEKVGEIDFEEYYKGQKQNLVFHLYIVTEWLGEPSESDEMKPYWFKIDNIPYDKMFKDDQYWLPLILEGKKIKAYFQFDENWNLLSKKITELNKSRKDMKHYIIVKFNDDYNYSNEIENIKQLFNKTLEIEGVKKVEIYKSNSELANRYDLMIKMSLTHKGLTNFDKSWIHAKWKNDYGQYIQSKTIFDCDKKID